MNAMNHELLTIVKSEFYIRTPAEIWLVLAWRIHTLAVPESFHTITFSLMYPTIYYEHSKRLVVYLVVYPGLYEHA